MQDQEEKLKVLALEISQRFPGLPFLVMMGSPSGGTLTMGNTSEANQIAMLETILSSFRARAARPIEGTGPR